jgi:hypothetical protein
MPTSNIPLTIDYFVLKMKKLDPLWEGTPLCPQSKSISISINIVLSWGISLISILLFYMLLLNLWLTCGSPCDGGNDVNMIQAADCGIGIEGKVNNPYYASYLIHLLLH